MKSIPGLAPCLSEAMAASLWLLDEATVTLHCRSAFKSLAYTWSEKAELSPSQASAPCGY